VTKASSTTMLSVRVPRAMVRELNKFVETQKLTWPMGRFTITSVVNGILKQYLADQHATDEDSSDRGRGDGRRNTPHWRRHTGRAA
jgi:hypothetical protein